MLLSDDLYPHITSPDSAPILHYHAHNDHTEDVIRLVEDEKCNVNVKDPKRANRTAMHVAVLANHIGMMQVLLRGGAEMHPEDDNGDTPFHMAALLGLDKIVSAIRTEEARRLVRSGVVGQAFYDQVMQV